MKFVLELDDFTEEVFYELERLSEGRSGHKCEVAAGNSTDAAEKIAAKLVPFIESQLKPIPDEEEG